MKVLVTGASGMLGHALMSELQNCFSVVGLTRQDADLRDRDAVTRLFQMHAPEMVIHAAAYTDVDGCELDAQRAWENNATATLHVASGCKMVGASIVYISTDYVFDGSKAEPYTEEDSPNPINVYGRSKLRGEQYVREILTRFFVVRTSWLYGPHGKNFVDTIRRLASEGNELHVVNDQRGSPTYVVHLARKIQELVQTKQYAIYHVTNSGACTWYELAQKILPLTGDNRVHLEPISSSEIARPARRPCNSVMANDHLRAIGLELLPQWPDALEEFIRDRLEHQTSDAGEVTPRRPPKPVV
jgi:dTDP-4-dehydrorhamnose reductase